MAEIVFVLVLSAVVTVVAAILFRWRKKTETRPIGGHLLYRMPPRQDDAGYSEPETRFVESPRRKQYWLLNASEQALYHRLVEAMPSMMVFCQVGIAQLAQLRGRQALQEIGEMIGRSVDFLVCRKDFSIVAAIELNWPTHSEPAQQKAQDAKRLALEKLAIPLIVFQPNELPGADLVAREIAGAILRRNQLEAKRDRQLLRV